MKKKEKDDEGSILESARLNVFNDEQYTLNNKVNANYPAQQVRKDYNNHPKIIAIIARISLGTVTPMRLSSLSKTSVIEKRPMNISEPASY